MYVGKLLNVFSIKIWHSKEIRIHFKKIELLLAYTSLGPRLENWYLHRKANFGNCGFWTDVGLLTSENKRLCGDMWR